MRRGTLAPINPQGSLLYVPPTLNCDSTASARYAYGTAAQEIAYQLLSIRPIPINGQYSTCFDGEKNGEYYEMKSFRIKGGKIVVYDFRIGKEQAAKVPLYYLLIGHSLDRDREDIVRTMANRPVHIYKVPSPVIHHHALQTPLRTLQKEEYPDDSGFVRGGYSEGYRNLTLKTVVESGLWEIANLENTIGTGKVTLYTHHAEKRER